jgi:hypothetical protein
VVATPWPLGEADAAFDLTTWISGPRFSNARDGERGAGGGKVLRRPDDGGDVAGVRPGRAPVEGVGWLGSGGRGVQTGLMPQRVCRASGPSRFTDEGRVGAAFDVKSAET